MKQKLSDQTSYILGSNSSECNNLPSGLLSVGHCWIDLLPLSIIPTDISPDDSARDQACSAYDIRDYLSLVSDQPEDLTQRYLAPFTMIQFIVQFRICRSVCHKKLLCIKSHWWRKVVKSGGYRPTKNISVVKNKMVWSTLKIRWGCSP